MSNPTWGIVMTVREPAQLVLANVHTHLAQGATQVHVFLDDPDDPVGPLLETVTGCVVTRCDADHWARINKGRRPGRQTRRQAMNATLAYRNSRLDWLIHLDADEFLFQHRPLVGELAHVPRRHGFLALPVRERAFTGADGHDLFAGAFRVPYHGHDEFFVPIYGRGAAFLAHGMSGHSAGKACVPVGRDLRLAVHAPRTARGDRIPPLQATSTVLLHFDGLTRLHWIVKMLRYATGPTEGVLGPHRLAQLAAVQACGTWTEIAAFHDRIKAVDAGENTRLTALGLLEHLPFALPDQAVQAVQAAGLSLDPGAFDAQLRARNADVLGALGQ